MSQAKHYLSRVLLKAATFIKKKRKKKENQALFSCDSWRLLHSESRITENHIFFFFLYKYKWREVGLLKILSNLRLNNFSNISVLDPAETGSGLKGTLIPDAWYELPGQAYGI